jgi:hypothetical protein
MRIGVPACGCPFWVQALLSEARTRTIRWHRAEAELSTLSFPPRCQKHVKGSARLSGKGRAPNLRVPLEHRSHGGGPAACRGGPLLARIRQVGRAPHRHGGGLACEIGEAAAWRSRVASARSSARSARVSAQRLNVACHSRNDTSTLQRQRHGALQNGPQHASLYQGPFLTTLLGGGRAAEATRALHAWRPSGSTSQCPLHNAAVHCQRGKASGSSCLRRQILMKP